MSRPVVVLGLSPTGLAVLRSLGPRNVPCLGIWWGAQYDIGRHSRYLRDSVQIPRNPTNEQILVGLDALTKPWRDQRPILVAASDVHATFIDEMQDELRDRYTIRSAARRLHRAFADKIATIGLCAEAETETPKTVAVETVETLSRVGAEFRFPVIVKPANFTSNFPGKNYTAMDITALRGFFDAHPHLVGAAIAQEVIAGGDRRIVAAETYSDRHGRVIACATVRKDRQWLQNYGMACYAKSEWVPAIASITETLLNRIGYQGFAYTEYVEDAVTGRYLLLEVNPRLGLPAQLVTDAKVDVIGTGFREMSDEWYVHSPLQRQVDGVYWWYAYLDVPRFLHSLRRGELSPFQWIRSIARASSFATFDWRDPKPWLASMSNTAGDFVGLFRGWLGARWRAVASRRTRAA